MSADESGVFDKNTLLAGRPAGLHKGSSSASESTDRVSATRVTEEPDIDDMIEKSGCAETYFKLEECLGEHDRDWRQCQQEVKALQTCSQAQTLLPKRS